MVLCRSRNVEGPTHGSARVSVRDELLWDEQPSACELSVRGERRQPEPVPPNIGLSEHLPRRRAATPSHAYTHTHVSVTKHMCVFGHMHANAHTKGSPIRGQSVFCPSWLWRGPCPHAKHEYQPINKQQQRACVVNSHTHLVTYHT